MAEALSQRKSGDRKHILIPAPATIDGDTRSSLETVDPRKQVDRFRTGT
jgi:hypothetical protein